MQELEKYTIDIYRLCSVHSVKSLYVFGSVLTEKFNVNSDIDFIVDFHSVVNLNKYADNYYDFKYSLQNILHRNIDLLEEKAIKNPYFLEAIKNQRKLVYGH
jgi:predicted nucleotidyltransferase